MGPFVNGTRLLVFGPVKLTTIRNTVLGIIVVNPTIDVAFHKDIIIRGISITMELLFLQELRAQKFNNRMLILCLYVLGAMWVQVTTSGDLVAKHIIPIIYRKIVRSTDSR